ncbi:Nin one binding Zn-ribbon like-domain-containing protein [Mycotypha africana]|uniref:Nin one binding Zn-ribbon like-domain-containing protein n=1 Tax=Mycotypha africana TaxID=64632 RepID=UPI002300DFB2|nr:Nin one binding Zn-ribbon like-domain-containing protein [Mycotypha africana]KAI8987512.1 Nin one binding Zn-ribbon like-domain-containing protein [Mycotypha africana]
MEKSKETIDIQQEDKLQQSDAQSETQQQRSISVEPKVKYLVIDTNAIINGMSLRNLAEEFYTIPEVLQEVRDARTREFLSRLPFEIKLMNPSEESMKAMVEFSKKTGDFGVLSQPDLKVLALTHTLEKRENGDVNIRTEPLKTRPTGALPSAPPPRSYIRKPAVEKQFDEDGWEIATKPKRAAAKNRSNQKNSNSSIKLQSAAEDGLDNNSEEKECEEPITSRSTASEGNTEINDGQSNINEAEKDEISVEEINKRLSNTQLTENTTTAGAPAADDEDEDSDGGEWITPDNVDEFKAAEIGVTADELKKNEKITVGCMTADFAMQNVLLQMNLNLVSAGGYRVKTIRNSVMRCHACFFVCNDLERKFCPKCGNATLQRVTCSTNSKGEIQYHLKKNFQYRLRGTRYDIPLPKGGRQHNNIVLREDQREYIKATQRKQKKQVVDMFDPDFIPLYGKTNTKEITNNMFGTDTVGFGRKNPNASKKRIGKKKRTHNF